MRKRDWFKNLLTLSSDDLGVLRKKVRRSFGTARIFVHPFYEDYYPSSFHQQEPERFTSLNPKVGAITRALFRIVGMIEAPPIIIFEEERRLDETRNRLASHAKRNQLYYVPTISDRGIPKIEPLGESANYPESFDELERTWNAVLNPLLEAEVASVILGGMFLEVSPEDAVLKPRNILAYREARRRQGAQNLSYDLNYCVASVIKEMAGHFEVVQVSCLAHPHSYRDIKRMEQLSSPAA